jgi:restriction system protein
VAEKRSLLIQYDQITRLMKMAVATKLDGQIFHARTGYGIIDNQFAICVKSSASAALLSPLPCKVLKDDGSGQAGYHVPDVSVSALRNLKDREMFVAKIANRRSGDSPLLWGNRNLYSVWSGKPCDFNLCD